MKVIINYSATEMFAIQNMLRVFGATVKPSEQHVHTTLRKFDAKLNADGSADFKDLVLVGFTQVFIKHKDIFVSLKEIGGKVIALIPNVSSMLDDMKGMFKEEVIKEKITVKPRVED